MGTLTIENPITLHSPKAGATKWIRKDTPQRIDKKTGEPKERVVLEKKGNLVKVATSKGVEEILILRPSEFKQIYAACDRRHQVILSSLLFTGMRYQELIRFREHPEWFDKKQFIKLPPGSGQKKVKRSAPERWIRLSYRGREAVQSLFDYQLPSNNSINQYLAYNFDIKNFSLKSLRKTYESWLVFYYPEHQLQVSMSQGHTIITQIRHYLNLPFTEQDKLEMKEFVEGWV
ncbi:MAG: site-specific integrase [Candidatus Thermoplasmatota archaeon]|jgi:integrase|nr:site-specific integrase [Candidatus Thermoplasmatota archaeon]MCL6002280.1 site-specific integrase [Candidatus Thermoplasmatota archaeon]